jgi:cell shape-determining protein MreC
MESFCNLDDEKNVNLREPFPIYLLTAIVASVIHRILSPGHLEEEAQKRKERLAALKRKLNKNNQQEEDGQPEKKGTDENTELPKPVFK